MTTAGERNTMRRNRSVLTAVTLLTLVLAGCATNDDGGTQADATPAAPEISSPIATAVDDGVATSECSDPSTATLTGTEGDDELEGTDDDDVIFGLGGNDVVRAHSGNDIVCGGPGDDQIGGGPGDDVIDGGDGQDDCRGGPGANTATNCESG